MTRKEEVVTNALRRFFSFNVLLFVQHLESLVGNSKQSVNGNSMMQNFTGFVWKFDWMLSANSPRAL